MHTNTHVHTYTHTPFSMLSQRQALGTYFHRDTSLLFLSSYAKSTIREVKVIFRFSSRYNIVSGLQSKWTLDLQLIYIYIYFFWNHYMWFHCQGDCTDAWDTCCISNTELNDRDTERSIKTHQKDLCLIPNCRGNAWAIRMLAEWYTNS